MIAPPPFDPSDYDYGPATASVSALLRTWMEIDWFTPPPGGPAGADDEAIRRFREHQWRAHEQMPMALAAGDDVEVAVVHGGWDDFAAWCARVRADTDHDWKYGELKRLARAHWQGCGWSPEAYVRERPWPPRPGDLLFGLPDGKGGHNVVWVGAYPRLDELAALAPAHGDAASFYVSFAHGDLLDALQWQLARGDDDTADNPFVPLVEGYARGVYPFSLSSIDAALFRFTAPPR